MEITYTAKEHHRYGVSSAVTEVKRFLVANGMTTHHANAVVTEQDDCCISVAPDCANVQFTMAVSILLCWLGQQPDKIGAYVSFRPKEQAAFLINNVSASHRDWTLFVDKIRQVGNVKINF